MKATGPGKPVAFLCRRCIRDGGRFVFWYREHAMSTDTHHIEISLNTRRHRVIHQGVTFADTHAALTLIETGHDPVHYFPRADVNMARLSKSTHTSHCPYKGDATYYHLLTEDGPIENAVWSYEQPKDGVVQIKSYLAFYPSRVDRIDETAGT
jgi:uncharacterized protein (DUF427 family)